MSDKMAKEEIKVSEGLRKFPAFPVCLVTGGSGKNRNIITAAMVHVFSFDPQLVGVGVSPKRHSHKLLSEGKDFVLNVPGKNLVKETLFCGTTSGSKVKKFELTGLEALKSEKVEAPSISQCEICIECRKVQTVTTGDHDWFIGEAVHISIERSYKRGKGLLYWGGEFRMPGRIIKER